MTGTIDQGFQADTTTTRSAETPTAKKPETARTPPTDTAPENPDATALGGAGRPLPLGDSGHQGDFGETFIRALAAAANLDALRADRDRAGVDWTLRYPAAHGRRGFPLIDVQVKSWSDPRGNDAAELCSSE